MDSQNSQNNQTTQKKRGVLKGEVGYGSGSHQVMELPFVK
jgi:hypothetical protein